MSLLLLLLFLLYSYRKLWKDWKCRNNNTVSYEVHFQTLNQAAPQWPMAYEILPCYHSKLKGKTRTRTHTHIAWWPHKLIFIFNPFKTMINLTLIQTFSSHRASNTLSLGYKKKLVNIVYGNDFCSFWDPFGIRKCKTWVECRFL